MMSEEHSSPLEEASPTISMQEIMSRDPEELTRADRDAIVRTLRVQRFQFMQEEQQEKPKRSSKKPATNISLADLGL
jgi:hypothetical protein